MFILAFVLYLITGVLLASMVLPDFWVNSNVSAAAGMLLTFLTLSLVMLLRKRVKLFGYLTYYIAIFLIVLIGIEGVIIYYGIHQPEPANPPDYIIVLGSGLYEQNKMTVELKERLDAAVALWKEHPQTKIILTGGVDKNRGLPQSVAMKEYLLEQFKGKKVPELIMEEKATNTYDNLYLSNEKVKELYGKPIRSAYIVTNRYHFARVLLLCSRIGIEGRLMPAGMPLAKYPAYYLREAAALAKSALLDGFLKY